MQGQHDNPAQILESAIRLIERGWCRHRLSRRRHGKMHYCLLGALHEPMRELPLERVIEIKGVIRPAIEAKVCSTRLGNWNDSQKTKAPVIKMLKEVKEELEVQAK